MSFIKGFKTIFILLFVISFHTTTYAQLTGGGNYGDSESETQSVQSTSLFEKSTVLKAGWANPKGNFGVKARGIDTYSDIFAGKAGMGAQQGFTIGLEGVSPTNLKPEFNTIRTQLGIKFGLQYTNNPVDWSNIGGIWEDNTEYYSFHFIDFKAGLIYAISPFQDFAVDLFYNPIFTISVPGEWYAEQNSYSEIITYYPEFASEPAIPFGLRNGIGFQIRYNMFSFSVENVWGDLEYEFTRTRSGSINSDGQETYKEKLANNSTLLTFGIAF